jgi:hypothetical protein
MKLPEEMPARPKRSEPGDRRRQSGSKPVVQPAGCCAKQCIQTPLGEVCHCVLDTPWC